MSRARPRLRPGSSFWRRHVCRECMVRPASHIASTSLLVRLATSARWFSGTQRSSTNGQDATQADCHTSRTFSGVGSMPCLGISAANLSRCSSSSCHQPRWVKIAWCNSGCFSIGTGCGAISVQAYNKPNRVRILAPCATIFSRAPLVAAVRFATSSTFFNNSPARATFSRVGLATASSIARSISSLPSFESPARANNSRDALSSARDFSTTSAEIEAVKLPLLTASPPTEMFPDKLPPTLQVLFTVISPLELRGAAENKSASLSRLIRLNFAYRAVPLADASIRARSGEFARWS